MSKYTPHSAADKEEMLKAVGAKSVDDLFVHVPKALKLKKGLNVPAGISQFEVEKYIKSLAAQNTVYPVILRGAGAYDHVIPSVVKHLSSREEFVTAYTPYQPEVSQGVLQAIFEYQTLMCELTGMDASNASVYDMATGAAEAVKSSCDKREVCVVSKTVHPDTLAVIRTYAHGVGLKVVVAPEKDGATDMTELKKLVNDTIGCVVVQNPNYYGQLEDMEKISELARENEAKFIYCFNPVSAMLLKTPAEVGADFAVGEGQPLGMPLSFGGPYLGIMTSTKANVRKLPGRIVGQTVDKEGRRSFVLTLQAREQHIRRETATSSICSNQALCALTATVYLSAVGLDGFTDVANQCVSKAHYLAKGLQKAGLPLKYKGEFFHEFVTVGKGNSDKILKALEKNGILGGLKLSRDEILWCATEKVTKADLDKAIALVSEVAK